jgi:putative ABC transport system permease protein
MNLLGSLQLGLIYSLMAMGIYIAFRVMDTADLTCDGSFTLGLAASAMLAQAGHPLLALPVGFVAGAAAGVVTGLLTTKGGVHPILAGILTMTGLYSVNIAVMAGRPNISLIGVNGIFNMFQRALPFLGRQGAKTVLPLLFCAAFIALLIWFFKTELGLMLRATGGAEAMVRSSSINADLMRITAIGLANALIALSGAVLAQYQGFADVNSGSGIVIVGLASVIIGEAFIRGKSIAAGMFAAAAGAVIYRILIAAVLYFNVLPAYFLKLLSALIVAAALAFPRFRGVYAVHKQRRLADVR